MKKIILIVILLISLQAHAQWPGCLYAFKFTGTDGEQIDSSDQNYKFTIDPNTQGPVSITMCDDNRTWKFYKGDNNLTITNSLLIARRDGGNAVDTMIIKFPPTLSKGKKQYYRDLYAGEIKFRKGVYRIKLPVSDEEWDELKEIKLCPDPYTENVFFNISKYQK